MAENIKQFFHQWCDKAGITPQFQTVLAGKKNFPRFATELIVDGHSYVGVGNSTTKKESQSNAARDFVQYLVRTGVIEKINVPSEEVQVKTEVVSPSASSSEDMRARNPVFRPGVGPSTIGEAYRPVATEGAPNRTFMDLIRQDVAEAENLDINAGIHGNWTLDNAKQRLNMFMQVNRIRADYKYKLMGVQGKGTSCEISFYVPQLNRTLKTIDSGSNKQVASKACALSMVRQLYHLGVIEAFEGFTKKEKMLQMESYEAVIDPKLEQDLNSLLNELNISPQVVKEDLKAGESFCLLQNQTMKEYVSSNPQSSATVSWCPPISNYNPWTGCNIDEGYLSTATMETISRECKECFESNIQHPEVKSCLTKRRKLPIANKERILLNLIRNNSVVIISGSTGCGKTTQVCQYILDEYINSNRGADCNIVVTQPRRISAVSVAERIAMERGENIGESVGYSVRFESCLPRPYGSIMLCTVGVLLRKMEGGLRGISHVIVDEIHERDVNTDFILILLRDMVHMYPDLRVILMSATLNIDLYSNYFNGCPTIEVEGRMFPVSVYFLEDIVEKMDYDPAYEIYKKKKSRSSDDIDDDTTTSSDIDDNMNLVVSDEYSTETKRRVAMMDERDISFSLIGRLLKDIASKNITGSVLVFLPGWNVIFSLMRYLSDGSMFGRTDHKILPLHSQLPKEDQRRVFEPAKPGTMKIILSTNLAESSLTIDDVVYVIDSCKAKLKMFTSHNNMTNYVTMWASKSNCDQRKGRAGRVQEGVCYRLITKARYEKLDDFISPEILRSPLHEMALTIKLLRLGSIGIFLSKAVETPKIDAVIEAEVFLREMKCLDKDDNLTALGKILARLPLEPRLGKMLILSCIMGVAEAAVSIAAYTSTSSEVFISERRLTTSQKRYGDARHSDHIAFLQVFKEWQSIRRDEYGQQEYCERKSVSPSSLKITLEAKTQLKDLLLQSGFPDQCFEEDFYDFNGKDDNLDVVAAMLCIGFYPNVCYHREKRKVLTMECKGALIHKSSVNCDNRRMRFPSPFFVFGEKIRTRAISCKQMTMVTAMDLLLFASRKVDFIDGVIKIDDWINLKMKPSVASAIIALRTVYEDMIIQASENPFNITDMYLSQKNTIDIIRRICLFNFSDEMEDRFAASRSQERMANFDDGYNVGSYDSYSRRRTMPPRPSYRYDGMGSHRGKSNFNRRLHGHYRPY